MSDPHIDGDLCLYAIGDIHGHKNRLQQILAQIAEDAAQYPESKKRIVFLGDYLDRGPESKGVVDLLLRDLPPSFETVFLRGNHEDVVLRILDGEISLIPSWLQFGGAATLASYGINPFRPGLSQTPDLLRGELAQKMPLDHRAFLQATIFSHQCGDYYFAHAGVRPGVALDQQYNEDLLWIRDDFMNSKKPFGKIVVHGHTITIEPDIQFNRIGIDTGAYATGRLTCLKLYRDQRQFFTT